MKVFTIIVTYNGMKWINQCLKSVINQSEVVVVDNNSLDDTVNHIKKNFPSIQVLVQTENLGFGIANNIGMSFALKNEADYVFLLNQDTIIEENTIEKLVNLSQSNPDYGIISPIHLNGNGNYLDKSFLYYINDNYCKNFISDFVLNRSKKNIYNLPMINAAAWLLPKNTLETVGGFDPMFFLYGEDDNYCQRVLFHNLKIGIAPNTSIRHDSGNNFKANFQKGSDRYFNKFLIRVKVKYGNINTDDYKKINSFKLYLLKQSVLRVLKLNFLEAKINWKKNKIILQLQFKDNVMKNRQMGPNYLDCRIK